jgi:hypothetical protein
MNVMCRCVRVFWAAVAGVVYQDARAVCAHQSAHRAGVPGNRGSASRGWLSGMRLSCAWGVPAHFVSSCCVCDASTVYIRPFRRYNLTCPMHSARCAQGCSSWPQERR